MTTRTFLLACLAAFAILAGCTTTDLVNIENRPVPVNLDGGTHAAGDVQRAIIAACKRRGWTPVMDGDARVRCSINLRGRHEAEVLIPYSESSFSILHASSSGLDYNERRQTIHRNYNRWVANLAQAIVQEMGRH